jgi:probable phosphoglycerate mutase
VTITRFILVRHGETRWNVEQRVQGHGNSDLTETGVEQAKAIARRLASEEFDLVVASDLGRAAETARHVAALCGREVVSDARLRERNFGAGEGMGYHEIGEKYPGAFSRTEATDPDVGIPGGESRRQFHDRIVAAFDSLAARHPGKRIAVVTHGGVLATIHRHIHGVDVSQPHRVAINNASFNEVCFEDTCWSVMAWDDRAHLDGTESFEEV